MWFSKRQGSPPPVPADSREGGDGGAEAGSSPSHVGSLAGPPWPLPQGKSTSSPPCAGPSFPEIRCVRQQLRVASQRYHLQFKWERGRRGPPPDTDPGLSTGHRLQDFWAFHGLLYLMDIKNLAKASVLKKSGKFGAPGWLDQLRIRLRLRSWSPGSWVQAPHRVLC